MAKPKREFQSIQKHVPTIDKVRTDIRIHCKSEPILRKTFYSVNINDLQFSDIFQSSAEESRKKRKKEAKKKMPATLKKLVAAHLNILYVSAKLDTFREEVVDKEMQQTDIINFKNLYPEFAQTNLDFSKTLTPEDAVKFLKEINQTNVTLSKELQQIYSLHQTNIDNFIKRYDELLEKFSNQLREKGYPMSMNEIQQLMKILGGVVND